MFLWEWYQENQCSWNFVGSKMEPYIMRLVRALCADKSGDSNFVVFSAQVWWKEGFSIDCSDEATFKPNGTINQYNCVYWANKNPYIVECEIRYLCWETFWIEGQVSCCFKLATDKVMYGVRGLYMIRMDQHSWEGSWWGFEWIGNSRSEFTIVHVDWCPFMHFQNTWLVSLMWKTLHFVHWSRYTTQSVRVMMR